MVAATAIDRGFLAGRPGLGSAWLSLLAVLHLLRAAAERAIFPYLAEVVEPLRDHLVRRLVSATLHRATDRAGSAEGVDSATVSRLTRQVESVRSLVAALLRTARPVAVTLVAATVGLATLHIVFSRVCGATAYVGTHSFSAVVASVGPPSAGVGARRRANHGGDRRVTHRGSRHRRARRGGPGCRCGRRGGTALAASQRHRGAGSAGYGC